jgi:hypothetical protein
MKFISNKKPVLVKDLIKQNRSGVTLSELNKILNTIYSTNTVPTSENYLEGDVLFDTLNKKVYTIIDNGAALSYTSTPMSVRS